MEHGLLCRVGRVVVSGAMLLGAGGAPLAWGQDTTPPTVTINCPAQGAILGIVEPVIMNITATDDDRVVRIDVWWESQGIWKLAESFSPGADPPPYSVRLFLYKALRGPSQFVVVAFDAAGNLGWATVSATYDPSDNGIGEIWDSRRVQPGGRIDAIEYLGNGVVVAGTRSPNAGYVFKSSDYGLRWSSRTPGALVGKNVTNIKWAGGRTGYLLTGDSYLWKTTNHGDNWSQVGAKISKNSPRSGFELSYGLVITGKGTLLVSDTNSTGGHIFRSTDGGKNWTDLGSIGTGSHKQPLYRFEKTGDGIIINGWNGRIFKSTDDGTNWILIEDLSVSPLYATEYVGDGILLQGTDSGRILRTTDNGQTWTNLGDLDGRAEGADDFVYLGKGVVVYSTYKGSKQLFRSTDFGKTWMDIGSIGTGVSGDWLDHAIYIDECGNQIGIGGTKEGYVVRSIPR